MVTLRELQKKNNNNSAYVCEELNKKILKVM